MQEKQAAEILDRAGGMFMDVDELVRELAADTREERDALGAGEVTPRQALIRTHARIQKLVRRTETMLGVFDGDLERLKEELDP